MSLFLIENIINIAIVSKGGRRACLIETAHVDYKEKHIDLLKSYVEKCSCIFTYDKLSIPNYPRYIISKPIEKDAIAEITNSSDLGSLLGMVYLRPDFDDYMAERIIGHIYAVINPKNIIRHKLICLLFNSTSILDDIKYEIYHSLTSIWNNRIKVCIYSEISKDRSLLYTNILNLWYCWKDIFAKNPDLLSDIGEFDIDLEYSIYTDDGICKRYHNIDDDNYFLTNFKDYANDIWNFSEAGTDVALFDNKPKVGTNLNIYKDFWKNIMAPYL